MTWLTEYINVFLLVLRFTRDITIYIILNNTVFSNFWKIFLLILKLKVLHYDKHTSEKCWDIFTKS